MCHPLRADDGLHDGRLVQIPLRPAGQNLQPHHQRGEGHEPLRLRHLLQAPSHHRVGVSPVSRAIFSLPACLLTNRAWLGCLALSLPVVVITTEETASAHVHVLLFLLLFLLLLLLLLLSGSIASSSGGYKSKAKATLTDGGSSTARRLHQQLANVLLTEVLGEQHGPVGLHGVVGSLEELPHQNVHSESKPCRCSRCSPSRQRQPG